MPMGKNANAAYRKSRSNDISGNLDKKLKEEEDDALD